VFFVTHSIEEAILLGDRIVILTRRPGRVKEIVPVNLPRPRSGELRTSREFVDLSAHVWRLIREEVDEMSPLLRG
jgi:NitT/TauT family transport system ATP-binding protein